MLVALALRLDRVTVSTLMVVVMFANGGNYRLPPTLFAFGQEALARACIYFVMYPFSRVTPNLDNCHMA